MRPVHTAKHALGTKPPSWGQKGTQQGSPTYPVPTAPTPLALTYRLKSPRILDPPPPAPVLFPLSIQLSVRCSLMRLQSIYFLLMCHPTSPKPLQTTPASQTSFPLPTAFSPPTCVVLSVETTDHCAAAPVASTSHELISLCAPSTPLASISTPPPTTLPVWCYQLRPLSAGLLHLWHQSCSWQTCRHMKEKQHRNILSHLGT